MITSILTTIIRIEYLDLPSYVFLYMLLSLHKQILNFPFVSHGVRLTSPREIISEWHKVLNTSRWCCLSRSSKVCVNVIKNPLSTVNSSVKLHFGLLANDAVSQNSNLQVLTPFNNPYFVRACKDFSHVCPSLIWHSLVESSSIPTELASCSVIVLPFK